MQSRVKPTESNVKRTESNVIRTESRFNTTKSYVDVCKSNCKRSLNGNDTRNIVFDQHPALLKKLRDVVKTSNPS